LSTIITFAELQDAAREKIAAATFFSYITILSDKGLADKGLEDKLRNDGFVISVQPIVGARRRDQSGSGWILDAEIMVKVMSNPERNDAVDGANIDIYQAIAEVIKAMCGTRNHSGSEFFQIGSDAISISRFDQGLWIYDLLFTKEILL